MISHAAGSRYLSSSAAPAGFFLTGTATRHRWQPPDLGRADRRAEDGGLVQLDVHHHRYGANLPMTRTPDAHFATEVRYKGQRSSPCRRTPDSVRFADLWMPVKPGHRLRRLRWPPSPRGPPGSSTSRSRTLLPEYAWYRPAHAGAVAPAWRQLYRRPQPAPSDLGGMNRANNPGGRRWPGTRCQELRGPQRHQQTGAERARWNLLEQSSGHEARLGSPARARRAPRWFPVGFPPTSPGRAGISLSRNVPVAPGQKLADAATGSAGRPRCSTCTVAQYGVDRGLGGGSG